MVLEPILETSQSYEKETISKKQGSSSHKSSFPEFSGSDERKKTLSGLSQEEEKEGLGQ